MRPPRDHSTGTWEDARERLSRVLGGPGPSSDAVADEWIREALAAAYGLQDASGLSPERFYLACQRLHRVVRSLEDMGDVAFTTDLRATVASSFSRFFDVELEGPPWRIDPTDDARPPWREWKEAADFGMVGDPGNERGGPARTPSDSANTNERSVRSMTDEPDVPAPRPEITAEEAAEAALSKGATPLDEWLESRKVPA